VRRILTPGRLLALGLVLLAVTGLALWLIPSDEYIFLPDRAKPVEPLVTVQGGSPDDGPGGIYLVDVLVRRANLLEQLFPSIREGSTLVPVSALRPPGTSDRQRRRIELQAMERSQEVAAAVALLSLGRDVDVRERGALIEEIVDGSPADGTLHPGEVITSLGGESVRTPDDLQDLLRRRNAGDEITLTVRGSAGLRRVAVTTANHPEDPSRPFVGVGLGQAADIDLPVPVKIDTGNIGGPSAGLAFALTILEELGRDVDRGHSVAVTGELELDGSVLPVGGLKQKTIGARETGIEVFVVPAGDNARIAREHAGGLRVLPVLSFRDALRKLATLPRRR
jgi:PDZ domain-containing protein